MPVPPQRPSSWNPIADTVGRVREIAGRAVGGSLTEEARRALPGAGDRTSRQFFTGGWTEIHNVVNVQAGWTGAPSGLGGTVIGGPQRLAIFQVTGIGFSEGMVSVSSGFGPHSAAPVGSSGNLGLKFPWFVGGGPAYDPLGNLHVGFPPPPFDTSFTFSVYYEAV